MRNLDTEVKYFDKESLGVPLLENSWGCMVDFLDTTLVIGSTPTKILSILSRESSDGEYWDISLLIEGKFSVKTNLSVIRVQGASDPILNRDFRVQDQTEDTIVVAISKTLSEKKPLDSSGTEDLNFIISPLGYSKVFGEKGDQKAIYKLELPDSKVCYLRVDNSCPSGQDPTWAKFSKVSMFENISSMEDYGYKSGVGKAPTYPRDYNRAEESIYSVWFNSSYSNPTTFPLKSPPNIDNDFYFIIGDKYTFYLHRKNLRAYNETNYRRDETYLFGLYTKLIYKEDPLPFILRFSEKDSPSASNFMTNNLYSGFTRDRELNNSTFNTEPHPLYETPSSDTYSLWLDDSYRSGLATRLPYFPYKNELGLNISDISLKFSRGGKSVLEGKFRGLRSILSDLTAYKEAAPSWYEIIYQEGYYYLAVPDRDYNQQACYLVSLNNWGI